MLTTISKHECHFPNFLDGSSFHSRCDEAFLQYCFLWHGKPLFFQRIVPLGTCEGTCGSHQLQTRTSSTGLFDLLSPVAAFQGSRALPLPTDRLACPSCRTTAGGKRGPSFGGVHLTFDITLVSALVGAQGASSRKNLSHL